MLDPFAKAKASGLPTYKPTAAEEKLIRDGMAFLVIKSPFFAHLLYNEMRIAYSNVIPYAATDARTVFFNPTNMIKEGFTIAEVAFVVAHEISHCFFGDLLLGQKFQRDGFVTGRSGRLSWNAECMNIAEDFRINGMLIESKIGTMPINKQTKQAIGYYDKSISEKGMESGVEIYEKLMKQGGGGARGTMGMPGGPGGHGGFDIHLDPTASQQAAAEAGQITQAIAAALESAKSSGQGVIPGAVLRIVGELLDPKVSWQDHLRSTCIRAGGDPQYDWRTIDRRLIVRPNPMYFAKMSHTGAGCVVIGVDTSGSINGDTLDQFIGEMSGIVDDLNPAQLVVIWCDADVGRVDDLDEPGDLLELHADVQMNGVNGGGGTAFGPVFAKVEEMDLVPDMVVYLTDAMGSFPPHEPEYPTIWAVIGGRTSHIPWGTVVDIDG